MTYKELIEKLAPYAEQEVDACLSFRPEQVTFWINEGDQEIITIDVHE